MRIPVHSPWLPGCIIVAQTFLVLTMAGLFPDRPRKPHPYIFHMYKVVLVGVFIYEVVFSFYSFILAGKLKFCLFIVVKTALT